MAGPINRLPIGLMSLFDIRNARYPGVLADFLQPTFELQQWMRAQAFEVIVSPAISINANVQFFSIGSINQVPQTEYWYLAEYSVWSDSKDADQLIEFAPGYVNAVPVPVRAHLLGDYHDSGATGNENNTVATATYGMPRILPPGSLLGGTVKRFVPGAAGTTTLQATAVIARLSA